MPRACFAISVLLLWAAAAAAQKPADPPATSTATCNLDDGREVYVRYVPVPDKSEKISNGKPWTPGGTPMTLFTETQLELGNSVIPVGAYTLYPIPGKEKWTLAVSKNVTPGAAYDSKDDIARATMDTAQVSQPPENLDVAFAHVQPRCTLRIYFGKYASFVDFTEK
ncbi:MAG TPA: DUF2911 domain-containing protein [Candidatus Aquilonibacter sp.]|nr:DUF2911 domain-containing protein [Candidatus Aquilonibacter sp.]